MARPKRGIARDSVFGSATATPAQDVQQGLAAEEKPNHQTAVWLGDEEVEWLDNQRRVVQRSGWRGITRSALIRAVIRSAMDREVDLSGVTGENALSERLASKS